MSAFRVVNDYAKLDAWLLEKWSSFPLSRIGLLMDLQGLLHVKTGDRIQFES